MDQLITQTNRAIQRLKSATTEQEAAVIREELTSKHLPAFDLLDGEHRAYGVHFRALVRAVLRERAAAARMNQIDRSQQRARVHELIAVKLHRH